MQIHELHPKNKIKRKKRIARGGKRGTYSGKGVKGQKSRAGAKMQPMVRELIKRYPKLRGYKFSPLGEFCEVNIAALDKLFKDGEKVNKTTLIEKNLFPKSKRVPVKILGKGEIKKKLTVEGCFVSFSAKEKIEKAGGKILNEKEEGQGVKKKDK